VLLCVVRLIVRTSVLKELKYEKALLQVDAMHVRYMEVTTCTRCGQQFFGSPDKGLGLAGEGRAEFVKHFFSQHSDTVTEADFKVEMRAAISSTDQGGPNIMRWHQQNDEAENASPRQAAPGKNMPPNSRGQELMVWKSTGQPSNTPANSSVFRGDRESRQNRTGNNGMIPGAGGLAAALQSARQLVQRPSVVERWGQPDGP
jgi:hypothetical protein